MLASAAYVHLGKPDKALALVRTILDEPGLPESQYTAPRCIEIMALIDAEETEPDRPLMKAMIKVFRALASDRKKAESSVKVLRTMLQNPIDEASDRTHRITLGLDAWVDRNDHARQK